MVEQSGPVETAVVMVSGWRLWVHNVIEAPTLGQSLLRRHLITEEQLARAIAIQRLSGERLGHVLVRLDYVAAAELDHILNRQRVLRWLTQLFG
jgi:hypothetical protein